MPLLLATALPWMTFAILILLATAVQHRRKYSRLPPGPMPLPIVGNILDFPRTHFGREFSALSKKFGDVLYLSVLGQDTVVLGSLKAARDLLDKRSTNYSDRPTSVMVRLVGYDWLTALINYGPRWRQHRRAIHSAMAPDIIPQYEAIQQGVARNFLGTVLRGPQDLASHIEFAFCSVVMSAIYGIDVREPDDKYYEMVERMAEVGGIITIPGNFPVECFPFLCYLPSWFPGGRFKKWAADAKQDVSNIAQSLFDRAKDEVARGLSRPSIVSRILQDATPQGDQATELENLCKEVAATLYLGGADSGKAAMGLFFLAMALYPEVQTKAQQELNVVVGAECLPEFTNHPSLPYVNALVKELLRWHPSIPMGIPHAAVADDEYNGFIIPSGTAVFVNIWAILRDPEVYVQPQEFMPERFLDSVGNLDVHGICPGRHFAESTLFILCASVLSAFEIGPPIGQDGTPVELKWEATDNFIVSHPKIHEYSIQPHRVLSSWSR